MNTTMEIGARLVELCRQGKNLEAIDSLYADDIVSIEATGDEKMPARMEGIAAIKGKSEWWLANHTVHSGAARGPFPHGDRFIVLFDYDITANAGPMAGQRMKIEEAALYTVRDGKIAKEEFFYHMG